MARQPLLIVVLLALLPAAAGADQIRLRNGNVLQGEARVLANGDVEVHSAMGVWTVPAARVDRVIEQQTLEEEVARALEARPQPTAAEVFELGERAYEQGSATLARRLWERVLELDPNHEGARRRLGYRWDGERWLPEAEYRAARGEVRYGGEWVAPQQVLAEAQIESARAARARAEAWQAAEEARLQALYLQQARADEAYDRETSYGIPYQWVLGSVTGPLVPSPWLAVPRSPAMSPARTLSPSRAPSPAAPVAAPVRGAHNHGGMLPAGPPR